MDSTLISAYSFLSHHQKTRLKNGKVLTLSDLLLTTPSIISKQCRINIAEVQNIIDTVCEKHSHLSEPLSKQYSRCDDELFTTGDGELDNALGGGIRTGMVWEIVGQSAAGKTQLALQLSLTVQLPPDEGGLSGSACYLTTSAKLPTSRLVEMTKTHPQLSAPFCSLSDVHTISTSNIPLLLHVLSDLLPKLILERTRPSFKPVKLLVIDALAELFHSSDKTTTQTLVERSRNLYEISSLLHNIASQHEIAILVLNEVGDAFDRSYGVDTDTDLVYSDQSRWFGRADSVPGESRKEASLGLVWANQVNVRILLSRTGRRRYLDDVRSVGNKLRKVDGVFDSMENSHAEPGEDTSTLVRRLSVIFSSIAPAVSLDYTVTMEGISVLQELPGSRELRTVTAPYSDPKDHNAATLGSSTYESRLKLCPLDVGSCTNNVDSGQVIQGELPADDDEEQYWENNDVPEYAYSSLALDSILSQSNP